MMWRSEVLAVLYPGADGATDWSIAATEDGPALVRWNLPGDPPDPTGEEYRVAYATVRKRERMEELLAAALDSINELFVPLHEDRHLLMLLCAAMATGQQHPAIAAVAQAGAEYFAKRGELEAIDPADADSLARIEAVTWGG